MTWDDLRDKPRFRDVADALLDFVRGAEWIIHNAPFDVAFLDAELALCDRGGCGALYAKLIDTLALARERFPGKRNNLDALCERFGVDNAQRTLHGALLDAQLLAEVYLAMTRGQESLTIDIAAPATSGGGADRAWAARPRLPLAVPAPSEAELAAHAAYLDALDRESKGHCVWRALRRCRGLNGAPSEAAPRRRASKADAGRPAAAPRPWRPRPSRAARRRR